MTEPTNRPGNEIIGEILEGLQHSKYDPVKAHAYYERTKHLKGRRKGAGDNVVPIGRHHKTVPDKKPPQSHHQVSPALQVRIHHLEARLNELRDHLRKLLASKQKSASTKPHHQTAAEKQKKAAANKKYQQQHKSELAQKRKSASKSGGGSGGSKSSGGINSMTEAQLRSAIKQTQINLHEAVAKARAAANRGTA